MDHVAQMPDLKVSDRLVFAALASHADDDGICWPSDETLAEHTGLAVVSHLASRKRLRKAGAIDWTTHGHNGSSNLYRILLDAEHNRASQRGSEQLKPRQPSAVPTPTAANKPRQPARFKPRQPAR